MKVQRENDSRQHMIVHSEKYCTWYRKAIWNIQYKFADVRKNDLRHGTRPDSHVAAL